MQCNRSHQNIMTKQNEALSKPFITMFPLWPSPLLSISHDTVWWTCNGHLSLGKRAYKRGSCISTGRDKPQNIIITQRDTYIKKTSESLIDKELWHCVHKSPSTFQVKAWVVCPGAVLLAWAFVCRLVLHTRHLGGPTSFQCCTVHVSTCPFS